MANKVFLDANVILDFILKRENYQSIKLIFELEERNRIKLFMSLSVLHIVAHWLTKYLGNEVTKITMLRLLDHIKIVDGNHNICVKALESAFNDIEDAIQYQVALHHKIDFIISSDKDFQKYSSEKLPIVDALIFNQLFS